MAAEVLERVVTARGELVLRHDGDAYEIIENGVFLMDTRDGRSERLLARAALEAHGAPERVLIGGLGVGFTLAEVVADARVREVTVVEIEPALIAWHAGPLAAISGGALRDTRVEVIEGDILDHLRTGSRYDIICLDVDNGPGWTVSPSNAALYDPAGTALLHDHLRPGGVLAVWSARPDPTYELVMRSLAREVAAHPVEVTRGEPDLVYLARF